MRVIVTGGCGYIGSMLVPLLLADGHEIHVIDPQWFGNGYLPDNPNLKMVWPLKGADAMIHLGGLTNNDACEADPALDITANRTATDEYLKQAQQFGVKRFIYASSVAAYGTSDKFMSKMTG